MCATIKKSSLAFLLPLIFISTTQFAQVTTTISTGSNWKDVLLLKSLKASEAYMATTNYNTYPRIAATAWTHSGAQITYRSLLKFDLAFIPAGTTVTSAVLYLNSDPTNTVDELGNTYSNSVYFQKVTQPWSPTAVTWNNQPTTTTAGRIWAASAGNGNIQVNITALVQGMVNSPSTNYGIQMALENEVYYASRNYASTDHANTALHPRLVITYAGTPDPVKDRMDYIFGGLNQTDINTGILTDYGLDLADHTLFNGTITIANEVDMDSWTALYASLLSSVINPSSNMVHLSTINQRIDDYLATYDLDNPLIDLPTLFIAYQSLRSDALTQNLLTNNSERLVDVVGRTQSPYTTNYAFATAPALQNDDDGNVNFIFRPSLFVNSSSKTFSSFQVDFNNGGGYQSMTFDTPKNIVYTTAGAKTLNFKLQFADGSVYYSYATFYVLNVPQSMTQARFNGNDAHAFKFPRSGDSVCPESFPNPETLNGIFYGATVTVEYGSLGSRPPLGCIPQFIKPLIVMESFDVSKLMGENHNYKNFTDDKIKGGINIDIDPSPTVIDNFGDRLETAGYDIIFVDYKEGTGDIVKNALLVENIIKWVNLHKINNPNTGLREGTVLLGQSIGGVVGRYAVCDMEKRWVANPTANPHHEVRLLICQDSPHRGANVPVGFQALVNDLATAKLTKLGLVTYGLIGGIIGTQLQMKDVVGKIGKAYKLLNDEEGPKEMLIVQDGRTNTFLDGTYRPMISFAPGYVPSFTMRALANGSECGVNSINVPGAELLNVNASLYADRFILIGTINAASIVVAEAESTFGLVVRSALDILVPFAGKRYKTNFIVRATPASGTNLAYNGKISIEKKIAFVIPISITLFNSSRTSIAGTLPWDTAPGGYFDLQMEKKKQSGLPTINVFPITETNLTVAMAKAFTHAPTVSTLDISTTPITTTALTTPYSNGNTSLSRFPSFDTQEYDPTEVISSANNSRHIQFTAQNANWVFNEMEKTPIANSCLYTCTGTSTSPVLSGPNTICDSNGIFSLSNIPSGSTVSWSTSANITYVSGQGTPTYTVIRSSSGNGSVSAVLTGACGNAPNPVQQAVRVGGFSSSDYPVTGTSSLCTNANGYFSTNVLAGATNYQWFWSSNLTNVIGQGSPNLSVTAASTSGGGSVGVKVANICDTGGSPATMTVIVTTCGQFAVSLTPNPASSQLTVELMADNNSTDATIEQVQLLNSDGGFVKESNVASKKIQLDIQGLPKGFYYVKVSVAGEVSTTRILIE